jgi:TonB family protein
MTAKVTCYATLLFLAAGFATVQAQSTAQTPSPTPECPGPIYLAKEVSKKAKVTFFPPPEPSKDKRAAELTGIVVLRVVLCRSGRVTDIEVVQKMPYDITDKAIAAAKQVRFDAAEKDGQTVSQRSTFEYRLVGTGP